MMQQTLILLKPDTIQRRVVGEIISRFERKGLSILAVKMLRISKELSAKHYAEHVGKPFYPALEEYITSGPVIAMVLAGTSVAEVLRLMLGATDGTTALPGTIRGDYSLSYRYNLVHASDSEISAAREIALFFSPDEILHES